MATATTARPSGSSSIVGGAVSGRGSGLGVIWAAIAVAWLVALAAQVTGNAAALHHHTLIEGGPPLWAAVPAFLLAWLVMIAAMMLPASIPAIRAVAVRPRTRSRPSVVVPAFLGAYALMWTAFGLVAFGGDFLLHHVVDATPWLAARPWLVEAALLLSAGAYQFAPSKRLGLDACRHPQPEARSADRVPEGAFRLGLDHGLACLSSSGALMLVMFGAGVANLAWMIILTALMAYEVNGGEGGRAASMAGFLAIGLAALVIVSEAAVL